jgi:beta-galactosidase/beta-glucuronidase
MPLGGTLDTGVRTFLHFEASDYNTTVFVNGQSMGWHSGGYDPFSFDVSDALAG